MATLSRHVTAFPLPPEEGLPEWLLVIPAGRFSGRDGRGPYMLDAEAVLEAFRQHGADLPVDFDHQTLSAEQKAGPVPVAGWITALRADEAGLWAKVAWTERGREALAAREYRYVSPVFRHDRQGRIVALEGAGLTHYPNLRLPAAAAREDLTETTPMPITMPPAITELLGLPEDADEEAVLAAIRGLMERAGSDGAAMGRAPDPREWVPMAQHRAVAEELAALQAARRAERADALVRAAMTAGKLVPALEAWAREYAARDPDGFEAWVAAAPVVANTRLPAAAPPSPPLTEEQRWVATQLGVDPAIFTRA